MRNVRTVVLAVVVGVSSMTIAPAAQIDHTKVEPGVLESTASLNVLARFDRAVPDDILSLNGLELLYRFHSVPAISASATPGAIRAIAQHPSLAYLEADKPIEFDLDSATAASRSKDVVDPAFDPSTPPILDGNGDPFDGSGIGIAIIDTGLDGLHPDFQEPGKVGANYLVLPTGPVSSPSTAWTHFEDGGHGTHVAGIAAGPGTLSKAQGGPVYEGVAPGSTIYAFNMFAGPAVSTAAIAFDWIIRFGADQDPPIKVVNNSWNCAATQCRNPQGGEMLHVSLASEMARSGVVVTWSAGNDRGDGQFPTTNIEARNRTPGIIGVGNYKDDGWNNPSLPPGTRDACLSGSSAWGDSADPTTWPDLAAPGRSVTSTFAFGLDRTGTAGLTYRDPITNENAYKSLSGTSMAAPHVAGLAALMLEANPSLTPAEIEYILKQTATPLVGPAHEDGCGIDYLRADPSHPWHAANYAAGHGLVHAYDAVTMALSFTGIPDPIANEPIPDSFIVARPGIVADHVFYLSGAEGLQTAYPDAPVPRAQPMEPNTSLTFRSAQLDQPVAFDALVVAPYIGTTGEAWASITAPRVKVDVWRESPGGARTLLATKLQKLWQIFAGQPVNRDLRFTFPNQLTIPAGERIRFDVSVIAPPFNGVEPHPASFWSLYWEHPFVSRLEFGHVVEKPAAGSRAACEARQDCALLDETLTYETMDCGPSVYDLTLFGPPGSTLIFSCETAHTTCVVAGMPGDPWGSCQAEFDARVTRVFKAGICMYKVPDGSRNAAGKCVGQTLKEDDD